MSEIAEEAGISKSLLFHYFHNKREFYFYLWENCAQLTMRYLTGFQCYDQEDFFDILCRGMQAKMYVIRKYPAMGAFALKAFYEKDPEICLGIQESYRKYLDFKANAVLMRMEPEQFRPGIDLEMMYREMYLVSEGYLWEMVQRGDMDMEKMGAEFIKMIEFWRQIYGRKKDESD